MRSKYPILYIPPALAVVRGSFSRTNAQRSWKRAAHISTLREVLKRLSRVDARIAQKVVGGSTGDVYRSWAAAKHLPLTSEEIGEGGHLHCIGEKQLDKVLLFFHGAPEFYYITAFSDRQI